MLTFFESRALPAAARLYLTHRTTPPLATFTTKRSRQIELSGESVASFNSPASIGSKWLRCYVNTPKFFEDYNSHSLSLIADATFWCVTYGLDRELEAMSPEERKGFNPSMEFFERTERAKLVKKVCSHLEKHKRPPHEIHFAISEAAKCIYLHYHPKDEPKESVQLGPRI